MKKTAIALLTLTLCLLLNSADVGAGSKESSDLSMTSLSAKQVLPDEILPERAADQSQCCVLRGDVNGDGKIDIGDITYLVRYLFRGGPPPPCLDEADVDGDGGVNTGDLTYFLNLFFFFGPYPPPCSPPKSLPIGSGVLR